MKTIKFNTSDVAIWFTSDLHIGHKNICSGTSSWSDLSRTRKFSTIEKMNSTIIDTINRDVMPDDTLFILGDVLFGNKQYLPAAMARIKCKNVYLIYGNHDTYIENNREYQNLFLGCYDNLRLRITDDKKHYEVILSHYAHRVWMGSHKGFIHLYGHSHGSIPDFGKSMDVGVDSIFARTGEYGAISFNDVVNIMDKIDIKFVDHHDSNTNAF